LAIVRPFRAIRYGGDQQSELDALISPPSVGRRPADRNSVEGLHPLNILHIIRGRAAPLDSAEAPPYEAAAVRLGEWLRDGRMVRDPRAAFYRLEQCFRDDVDTVHCLHSVLGLLRLEDGESPGALPHEGTEDDGRIDDIVQSLHACRAQVSMVMVLVPDPGGEWAQWLATHRRPPEMEAITGTGERCRLTAVTDDAALAELVELARERTLAIADGHHRYEASARYRQRKRLQERLRPGDDLPLDYVLAQFVRVEEPTLRVTGAAGAAEVYRAALQGHQSPPKSTRFYPKAPKGLVLASLRRF
jgi:uncharacterized protein (DUF1015 family)